MLLKDVIATGAISIPWSCSIQGVILPGNSGFAKTCERNCKTTRACLSTKNSGEGICPHGVSYFSNTVGAAQVVVFGVKGRLSPTKASRHIKQDLKGRNLDHATFNKWIQSLSNLDKVIDSHILERQSELLDPLHDPIRLARQLEAISIRLLDQHSTASARTLDAQLDQASTEMKSLVKAAGLLNDYFDLISIYFNPAAARFGRPYSTSLHGILRKITSILSGFETTEDGIRAKINLRGESYRNFNLRESFKIIPFSLISNAVKYCLSGDVTVSLREMQDRAEVSVTSQGPPIEKEELELIFQKKYRGKWSRDIRKGEGVGLYLAKIVADAHNIEISATSQRLGGQKIGDTPLATNIFRFEIPFQINK
ncbi:Signal transduction histidine kinase [Pseudomonas sp. NFPP33]|nr:ATP-binding protein [Pseudomonas sp. NFPP33]SDA56537.1 Signal transduction histidine kinase [Pseudomonas sp. NFPP33]